MRGKKGIPHPDPEDPPRRRANKVRGHGTWENDRPPVCGVVGRECGRIRLTITERSDGGTLEAVVRRASWPMVVVNTDEWCGYNGLPAICRCPHCEHSRTCPPSAAVRHVARLSRARRCWGVSPLPYRSRNSP